MKVITYILLLIATSSVYGIENKLKGHASPYLAMHGKDPVAWQEWSAATVERAKKENKLLFVSSGYFSCHWCHVMQKESYQDQKIAKVMNQYFIPVKIDREIHSALDDRLIDFVEKTQGQAGWPLNVFITPKGYPLIGMTYVPPNNFLNVLTGIATKWREDMSSLISLAENATSELEQVQEELRNKNKTESNDLVNLFQSQADSLLDDMAGGFGDQNKFPSYPQLNAMLKLHEIKPESRRDQFLRLTLDNMATQGLNDQLSGGFFRYVVDPNWQIPHFEKMLYDNALLASLYMDAASILGDSRYDEIARQTLDFLIKSFRETHGGFIASLSAIDNKNIEGGYYLWQKNQLKNILTNDEFNVVSAVWNIRGEPELDAGFHLVQSNSVKNVIKQSGLDPEKANAIFASAKEKLLKIRNKRVLPRDDKIITSWNALLLSALSKAAKRYNDEQYRNIALQLKDYIYTNLYIDNELYRSRNGEQLLGKAGLEDYAYLADGLDKLLNVAPSEQTRRWLISILDQAWKRFYQDKGWLLAENMLLKYLQVQPVIADGVLPSASAILMALTLKYQPGRLNVQQALQAGYPEMVSEPFWYVSHIMNIERNKKTVVQSK